ncbi:hypothetical protein WJX84_001818 [Apatococcus fuscideae]|uniref:VHS domain-containing protein n=1 Tax=Apatococcus fuscideae TaxID=2026836 RepID=A0AAW1T3R5_9CHLO
MKSVKTFQSSIQKTLSRKNTSTDMIGEDVEEYCRIATGKTLPGPDEDLNRQVVESINTCRPGSVSAFQIANILKNRLQMKNSHKQWLAVLLVQKILQECGQMIAPARSQIIQEVAHIAAKPMNRYSSDLPGQQKAKTAAFSLLRNYGREGQDALRGVAGIGRGPMGLGEDHSEPVSPKGAAAAAASGESRAPSKRLKPWPQLREAVQTAIATANSHTEMMQDMLLNLSKEGSDDYDFQRGFLNDLVGEIRSFRNAFEQLLASLANHDNDEANSLMVSALETVEMMNNALQLKEEVTRAKDDPGASTPTALKTRLPPVGLPRAAAGPVFVGEPIPGAIGQAGRPTQPMPQASPFDAIAELQSALAEPTSSYGGAQPTQNAVDPFATAQMPTQQQSHDPFAASTLYGGTGSGYTGGQGGTQQRHPLQAEQTLPAYPVSATMSAANPFAPGVSFPEQQQAAPHDPFAMPSFLPPQAGGSQQSPYSSPAREPHQAQQPGYAGYGSPGSSLAGYNSPAQQEKYPGPAQNQSGAQKPVGASNVQVAKGGTAGTGSQPALKAIPGASAAVPNGTAAPEEVESEWDMFFADRVGSTSNAPPAKATPALSPADEFDELVQTRRTSDQ